MAGGGVEEVGVMRHKRLRRALGVRKWPWNCTPVNGTTWFCSYSRSLQRKSRVLRGMSGAKAGNEVDDDDSCSGDFDKQNE